MSPVFWRATQPPKPGHFRPYFVAREYLCLPIPRPAERYVKRPGYSGPPELDRDTGFGKGYCQDLQTMISQYAGMQMTMATAPPGTRARSKVSVRGSKQNSCSKNIGLFDLLAGTLKDKHS